MVHLTRIYTRLGDDGETHLATMARLPKTDPLIAALGDIAEANAALGFARAANLEPRLDAMAERLQQEFFALGADLATPLDGNRHDAVSADAGKAEAVPAGSAGAPATRTGQTGVPATQVEQAGVPATRVGQAEVAALERDCDVLLARLEPLRSFVLPGGREGTARLHLASAVVRRAERSVWAAAAAHGVDTPGGLNSAAMRYLNRASDLVFLMARSSAGPHGETLWHVPPAPR
ncbi:MAG: ATP:cob(I)alamin adenosyltransferase [Bifidobacteriaceae bacterium]|jgi:cob(I)alamin adenosyltransferase|nr:ATP:cob(I)alamin adenosyltransferase [Bifidobacteriaceae bacterium]